MESPLASDQRVGPSFLSKAIGRFGALPAGVLAGAVWGALLGGVGGRIVMRLIFLFDRSKDGAETDFGTAGEITFGGTLTLAILCTIAGATGGAIYVAVRRWLPWPSPAMGGVFFGLLMIFGPGVIFLGEVDLQIFEPAVPIFLMFVALAVLYGVSVVWLTDRLHPPRPVKPGQRMDVAAGWGLRAVGVLLVVWMILVTYNVYDNGGTCLTADGEGGCGIRVDD